MTILRDRRLAKATAQTLQQRLAPYMRFGRVVPDQSGSPVLRVVS